MKMSSPLLDYVLVITTVYYFVECVSIKSGVLQYLDEIGFKQCCRECILQSDCTAVFYNEDLLACYLSTDTCKASPACLDTLQMFSTKSMQKSEMQKSITKTCRNHDCPDHTLCLQLTTGSTTCVITRCDDPLPVNRTTLSWQYYSVGTVGASFTCNPAYPTVRGIAQSATCLANGTWAPSSYRCLPELVHLFVQNVTAFSSQWSTNGYSAQKIIGAPDVYPNYGDFSSAYLPGSRTAQEYIGVIFCEELFITEIHIYETYHPGSIRAIDIKKSGLWEKIWETNIFHDLSYSRIFKPNFTAPDFKSREVKIHINNTVTSSYTEFDAVKIVGTRSID